MQTMEITTFDQAKALLEQQGLTIEKAAEPKLWLVDGVHTLDTGGVIQEARRRAAQHQQPRVTAGDTVPRSAPVELPISQIRRDGGTNRGRGSTGAPWTNMPMRCVTARPFLRSWPSLVGPSTGWLTGSTGSRQPCVLGNRPSPLRCARAHAVKRSCMRVEPTPSTVCAAATRIKRALS